jgi:hypothetical protein
MILRKLLLLFGSLAILAAQTGCVGADASARDAAAEAEWLHEAVDQLTEVMVYEIVSPPQASRTYTYSSIAAYEILALHDGEYPSLAGRLNGLTPVPTPDPAKEYDLAVAGVYAYLTVGKALTFSPARMEEHRQAVLARAREMGVPRGVVARSAEYAEQVAQHVLAWAREDRFAQTRGVDKYTVVQEDGRWIPTAPAYLSAIEPNWGTLRTFALDSASQFRPAPPHPYSMVPGSEFYRQVRAVYEADRALTSEHRAIAAHWDCNPYVMHLRGHVMVATKKISPGAHWVGVTTIAARKARADLARSAEAYVMVSLALADGFISAWEEKYRSNLLRPETVIRVHLDPEWQPLLQTPPFPEYTSGHSVISTAAAEVLTALFGDDFAFEDSTEVKYGLPVRPFESFRQAAAEAAMSRLYGGIHYPMAIDAGIEQGRSVGHQVLRRLQPERLALVETGR